MTDNIFFNRADLKHCGSNVIIGKTARIRYPELVSIGDNVIIDDVRYQNEIKALRENGYFLIKLKISRELQISRLRDLYKDTFSQHYKNIDHVSELFIDVAPDDIFDIVVDVDSEDAFDKIKCLL